ncbi:MAG: ABC transporter substrate-binding protein, partial [Microcystaceae cyanobacterium]
MFQGFSRQVNKFSRLFQTLCILVLCLGLMVGCGSSQAPNSSNSSKDEKAIAIGTILKPRTIDPADSYDLAGLMVVYNLGETLYSYKLGTTELQPQLAAAMPSLSADGLVYTIPIKEGIKFHDGTTFNAEAMAFSLNRFVKNAGEPSFLLSDTLDKAIAKDGKTLVISLKKPFAAFPALLAFPGTSAVSPQAYQEELGEGKFKPEAFVGTGPYKLAQFSSDSLKLETFPDYWGEK